MAKTYDQRLTETCARSLSANMSLYQQRSAQKKPCGVLERVILEQARCGSDQSDEGDSCAGSRLDYGSYD
jgi:hypothetical protein